MNQRAFPTPPRLDHEHVSRISTSTILFIIAAAALALYELQVVLIPFVLAAVVSYICAPAIAFASAKAHLPRPLVAIVSFLALLTLVGVIGFLGIQPLGHELTRIATDFQGILNHLTKTLIDGRTVSFFGQPMDAQEFANAIGKAIRDWAGNARVLSVIAGTAFVTGFGFLLTLVLLFFFMVTGPSIVQGLLWLVPPGQRPLIEDHILSQLDPVLRRYFLGVVAVVCFAATFAYVGLGLVLGIPHAVFLALVTGILEAAPIIGPAVAAIVAGLVAIQHNSGLGAIIGYAVYLTALRLSIDQLFGPLVLGAAGRVNPALIIFCFLAGGALFGMVGIITGVPIALVIKATLSALYDEPASGLDKRSRTEMDHVTKSSS